MTTGGGAGTNPAIYQGTQSPDQLAFFLSDTTAAAGTQAPEPAGIAVSGMGVVALAFAAYRRKRRG